MHPLQPLWPFIGPDLRSLHFLQLAALSNAWASLSGSVSFLVRGTGVLPDEAGTAPDMRRCVCCMLAINWVPSCIHSDGVMVGTGISPRCWRRLVSK